MRKKTSYLLQIFLLITKSEHLHLGYCEDPDAIFTSTKELRDAQENYLQLCMSIIPEDVNKILDVGCGTGEMLQRLSKKNYQVKGMVPDVLLAEKIGQKVSPKNIILSKFQDFNVSGHKFDLLLFMESFGYIRNMRACLEKSLSLLNKGGYILISDFFSKDLNLVKDDLYKKNFHSIDKFRDMYIDNPALELLLHKDITANTLPTVVFANSIIHDYALPILDVVITSIVESSFAKKKPYLFRLFKLLFKKIIQKKHAKTMNRLKQMYPGYYRKLCSYEIFLLKKV